MILNEGLEKNDLSDLVENTISIDQYKPKVGSDSEAVVLAFTVMYENPADDLADFIGTSHISHLDVESSTVPNENGFFKVFVEFERNEKLIQKIMDLLNHISKLTGDIEWNYVSFKDKEQKELTLENLKSDIITSQSLYDKLYKKKDAKDSIKERIEFLLKY